jgi:hypothetical protein
VWLGLDEVDDARRTIGPGRARGRHRPRRARARAQCLGRHRSGYVRERERRRSSDGIVAAGHDWALVVQMGHVHGAVRYWNSTAPSLLGPLPGRARRGLRACFRPKIPPPPGRATTSDSCSSRGFPGRDPFCSSRHPTSRFTGPPPDLGRLSGPALQFESCAGLLRPSRIDVRNQSASIWVDVAFHVVGSCRSCREAAPV